MAHYDDLDSAAVDIIARQSIQDIDLSDIKSPALRRLIEDIRVSTDATVPSPQAYNRVHNRHNRGR